MTHPGNTSSSNMINSDKLTLGEAQTLLRNIGLPLRTHQVEGVQTIMGWYNHKHGGILADEMGLGKTCQAIVAVAILSSRRHYPRTLVICPLSVLDHWENEIKRFSCNRLKVFRYYGSKEQRVTMRRKLLKRSEWNVLLTTFETFLADSQSNLMHFNSWDFAVFDEAHRIKNDLSLLHNAVNAANISWLLLMTGTPIQNNLPELYALLKLVDAQKFPAEESNAFVAKYKAISTDRQVEAEFREVFNEYCLRRNKNILEEVPKCSEVVLYHSITKMQYELYKALLTNNRDFFIKHTNSEKNARQSLMMLLVQLRKCCNHPYLFHGIEPEPFTEGEHLVAASGKLLILDRLLRYLKQHGHRVLIFSQMKRFLDIVNDFLALRGYTFEQLDGSTKTEMRLKAVENFQRPNSDVFAFLLTTKAGGLGLNLTAADTAIFLDWDFNPQNDKQAAARCHRIGQDKPVKIIRLIAKHTVEELIKYRAAKKLKLSELVLGTNEKEGPISSADFANLILEGLKELEEAQTSQQSGANSHHFTDKQLEEKIGRTLASGRWEIQTDDKENLLIEQEEDPAIKTIYMFEGRDYAEDRQALDRLIGRQQSETQQQPTQDEQEDNELAQKIQHAVRSTRTTGTALPADFGLATTRPARPRLTDEEMAERRRKRREAERERRERMARAKEEQKQRLWAENDYVSTNLPLPEKAEAEEKQKAVGNIYDMQGDVTQPERAPKDECAKALVLQIVDDGGHFGTGGVFSALRKLNDRIPQHYELAARMQDLHTGDSHLIENVTEQQAVEPQMALMDPDEVGAVHGLTTIKRTVSVVLMVVQSVRDRYTKMINKHALQRCLDCVQQHTLKNGITSVHLPQIWFGVQNINESEVRRLLDRHLCAKGINVYIYRFQRVGHAGRRHDAKQQQVAKTQRQKSPTPPKAMLQKRKRSPPQSPSPPPRKRAPPIREMEEDEEFGEDEEKQEEEEEYEPSESEFEQEDEEDEFEEDFEAEEDSDDDGEEREEWDEFGDEQKRQPKRRRLPAQKKFKQQKQLGGEEEESGGEKNDPMKEETSGIDERAEKHEDHKQEPQGERAGDDSGSESDEAKKRKQLLRTSKLFSA